MSKTAFIQYVTMLDYDNIRLSTNMADKWLNICIPEGYASLYSSHYFPRRWIDETREESHMLNCQEAIRRKAILQALSENKKSAALKGFQRDHSANYKPGPEANAMMSWPKA